MSISSHVVSGHAKGHLREAFLDALEGLPREPCDADLGELRTAAGRLWNCTDVLPGHVCDDLDLPRGSSYARGARQLMGSGSAE
jgi:hypothetical protein